jgi:hypothetical protein
MRPTTLLKFSASLLIVIAAPLNAIAQVAIVDNNQVQTLDCRGQDASIMGNDNVLTLKNCKRLLVTGNQNAVIASPVELVSVTGNENKINFVRAKSIPANAQILSSMGNGNRFHEMSAAQAASAKPGSDVGVSVGPGAGAVWAGGNYVGSSVRRPSQVDIRNGGIRVKTTGANGSNVNIGPNGIQIKNADGTSINLGN